MQPDDRSRRRPISRASLRRRRVTLIGALAAVAALVQAASAWVAPPSARTGAARAAPSSVLRVTVPSRSPLTYVLADYRRSGRLDHEALARAVRRDLPSTVRIRRGTARVTYRYDRTTTLRRVKRTPPSGATVAVAPRAISARVPAPVVAQALRNNCESAALSILLATQGARVGQLTLQGELPRSGALDPATTASGRVWGDPERGYVGRPDGGGGAGGFGVYPRPVAAVAARHDVRLTDLSSDGPSAVYKALRQGRAVMA